MLQSNEFVTKVTLLVTQAQEAEKKDALPKALQFYEQALAFLLGCLKSEQHKYLKDVINGYANQCLAQAEYIKELIQSGGSLEETHSRHSRKKGNGGSGDEEVSDEKSRMMHDLALTRIDPSQIGISWDDIVGMRHIKKILDDAIHLPLNMPHLFVGNRMPIRSLLFYGPPGTGKTLLGKATAGDANMPFYSVSSAELISKWVGESEKYVKALFETVKQNKPCILFLDEIESLCAKREETSNTKTVQQFLVQLDGISQSGSMQGVLLIGCTNTPWQLDEAMIRRLEKRIYVSLPNCEEREALLHFYLTKNDCALKKHEFREIAQRTEYFSSADIHQLAKSAAMIPIDVMRSATTFELLEDGGVRPCSPSYELGLPMTYDQVPEKECIIVPPITYEMVLEALKSTKSTVDVANLKQYERWTEKHGQ